MDVVEKFRQKIREEDKLRKAVKALSEVVDKKSPEEGIFFQVEPEKNGNFKNVYVSEGTMLDGGIWSNSPAWSPTLFFFENSQARQTEQAVGCYNCEVNKGRGGMLRVISCQPETKMLVAGSVADDRLWEVTLFCRGRHGLVEKLKSSDEQERDLALRNLEQLPCSRGRIEVNLKNRLAG